MSKNITIGISDELSERMEQLKEVNWSAVARDCIEQYIRQRMSKGLEPAVLKVKELRGSELRKGQEFVIQNSESMGLAALEEIAYPDKEKHTELLFELLDNERTDAILRYDVDDENNVQDIRFKVSSNFTKGMREAAKELLERSK